MDLCLERFFWATRFLFYFFLILSFLRRALDEAGHHVSFWAHVNLPYRIVSSRLILQSMCYVQSPGSYSHKAVMAALWLQEPGDSNGDGDKTSKAVAVASVTQSSYTVSVSLPTVAQCSGKTFSRKVLVTLHRKQAFSFCTTSYSAD